MIRTTESTNATTNLTAFKKETITNKGIYIHIYI